VHDEVDHVHAVAVGFAVAAEAVGGVGLGIDLHRRGVVGVEGATQHVVFAGLQAVVLKHLLHAEAGFEGLEGHIFLHIYTLHKYNKHCIKMHNNFA